MYICVCRGISEEKIRSLKLAGRSTNEIVKILGIGKDCGICLLEKLEIKDVTSHCKKEKSA